MTSIYFCKLCNVDCHTWQELGVHEHKVESPVSRYASELHLAKGILFCRVCSMQFDTIGQMREHVEKHEKERKIVPRNVLQSDDDDDDDDDKLESNNNNDVEVKTIALHDRGGRSVNVERLESVSKEILSEENELAMVKKVVEEKEKLFELERNTLNSMKWMNKLLQIN